MFQVASLTTILMALLTLSRDGKRANVSHDVNGSESGGATSKLADKYLWRYMPTQLV